MPLSSRSRSIPSLGAQSGAASFLPARYVPSDRTRELIELIERQQRDVDAELAIHDEKSREHRAARRTTGRSWVALEDVMDDMLAEPARTFDDLVQRSLLARHLNAGAKWCGFCVDDNPQNMMLAVVALSVLQAAGFEPADRLVTG